MAKETAEATLARLQNELEAAEHAFSSTQDQLKTELAGIRSTLADTEAANRGARNAADIDKISRLNTDIGLIKPFIDKTPKQIQDMVESARKALEDAQSSIAASRKAKAAKGS
jgi:septation ring formation regulator EzrA